MATTRYRFIVLRGEERVYEGEPQRRRSYAFADQSRYYAEKLMAGWRFTTTTLGTGVTSPEGEFQHLTVETI